MTTLETALAQLRRAEPLSRAGLGPGPLREGLQRSGIRFVAVGSRLEERWHQALTELERCIRPLSGSGPVLNEGGVYYGSWIESTGTINAEILSRFAPEVTAETHLLFAEHQRADGMIPYKVTDAGPGFSQIQIVTPLARSVWNQYRLNPDEQYLRTMYRTMVRFDAWLAQYRDTRGTGAVEAFCTFDTGHDLSPRFWFVPERSWRNEATRCDPNSAILPYLAPDLTANVACQRAYLARIAAELGEDAEPWHRAAEASIRSLYEQCFDEADGLFYDRDARGEPVRIQSDVLLRVLACEVGDEAFFSSSLERYLMNTGKFLSHYGFTSLAMDDPRFDHDYTRNSWGGPVNYLSLIRAPHAFEHHGHVAELALTLNPLLAAAAGHERFPQCLDPWTGTAGFTEQYSPSILWLLDAIERQCGILPRPDGELWFTGLSPTRLDHQASAEATGYARTVDGIGYELVGDDSRQQLWRDGELHAEFPRGWRLIADRAGQVQAVLGMSPQPVSGTLDLAGQEPLELTIAANERVELTGGRERSRRTLGFVAPRA